MSPEKGLALGEAAMLGGLRIVVERPHEPISTTAFDSDECLNIDATPVRGHTGTGVGLLRITVQNTGTGPIDLGLIDIRLTDSSHFDRDAAEGNHFTFSGEKKQSFLQLLNEGRYLAPDEVVSGLVTYTIPIIEDPDLGQLELQVPRSESDELRRVRWDLAEGEGDRSSEPDEIKKESQTINTDRQGDDLKRGDGRRKCDDCGAELTEYEDVEYCPMCGERQSGGQSSTEPELVGTSQPRFCSNCQADLSEYDDVKHCPECGMLQMDDAAKTEAAALLGKATFGEFRDLQPEEFEHIVALLDCADQEFRSYALHVLAMHQTPRHFDKLSERYEEIVGQSFPRLIDLLDQASPDAIYVGATPTENVPRVSDVTRAILNILTKTKQSGGGQIVWDESQLTRLAEIAITKLGQTPDPDTSSKSINKRELADVQIGLIKILSKIVHADTELIEPSLEDLSHIAKDRLSNTNWTVEIRRNCPYCNASLQFDHPEFVRSCAELIESFAESHPSAVSQVIKSILNHLEHPDNYDKYELLRITDVLVDVVDSVPGAFENTTDTLTELALYGSLPTTGATVAQPWGPQIGENIAKVLAALIVEGEIDSSVVIEGLKSDDQVYIKVMVEALEQVALENPTLVDNAQSELVSLVTNDYHYSIKAHAANALGHLESPLACQPLLEAYTGANGDNKDSNYFLRESVGRSLDGLESAHVDYYASSALDPGEALQCASCGEHLGWYDAPVFCPSCGTKLCAD